MKEQKNSIEKRLLSLYSIMSIALGITILQEFWQYYSKICYGADLMVFFNLDEFLGVCCIITVIITFYYAITTFFCSDISEKFKNQEKTATFLFIASLLFSQFGGLSCFIVEVCMHSNCLLLADFPIIVWIITTPTLFSEKKKLHIS